jgi:predicted nucleotidyltransferase
MLELIFGSKLRVKVLGRLFANPEERYYVRQLTALIGEDSTNVSRELARLEKTGILISTAEGKQKYYQANKQSPVFNELKGLLTFVADGGALNTASPAPVRIKIPKEKLAEFCRRRHIKKLSLFGSVLRDDFGPDSDVDVLVEFETGHTPGFAIIDMENELSGMVGRKVDMRTPNDLSRYFRDRVVRESRVEYAKT